MLSNLVVIGLSYGRDFGFDYLGLSARRTSSLRHYLLHRIF